MMHYIESTELREWVKKNLQKTIVLKAHELATQTGCEVLLKIRDTKNSDANFYYATETLQEEYNTKGITKQTDETCVSGETGLPIYPRVSISTQSEQTAKKESTLLSSSLMPLHLSVDDSDEVSEITGSKVKLEVEEEPGNETDSSMEFPSMLGGDDIVEEGSDDIQVTAEGMTSFRMQDIQDNSTIYPTQVQNVFSPKLYQCAVCQKTFRSVQVLQKHTQTFHVKQQAKASLSQKTSRPIGRFASSIGRPLAPKRHNCTVCTRSFPTVALLNDHMSRSHMMASTNFRQTSMEVVEEPHFVEESNDDGNMDDSGEGDSMMPKISQVMSLQPALLGDQLDPSFSLEGTPTNQVFQSPGASTSSGAGATMSMPKIQLKPKSSTRISYERPPFARTSFKRSFKPIKKKGWTSESLNLAADLVTKKKMGLKDAAKKFNIPLTTLHNKMSKAWTFESMEKAIQCVCSKKMGLREAAREFNIPTTTLHYKISKIKQQSKLESQLVSTDDKS